MDIKQYIQDSIDTKTFTDEEKSIAQQMKILKRILILLLRNY